MLTKDEIEVKKQKEYHRYLKEFDNVKIRRMDNHDENKRLLCFGYYLNSRDLSQTAKVVFVDTKKQGSLLDKMVMGERKTYVYSPLALGKYAVVTHSYKGKDKIFKEVYSSGNLIDDTKNLMDFINSLNVEELSPKEQKLIEIAKFNMKLTFERKIGSQIKKDSFWGKIELKKMQKDVDEMELIEFVKKYEKKYRTALKNGLTSEADITI